MTEFFTKAQEYIANAYHTLHGYVVQAMTWRYAADAILLGAVVLLLLLVF